MPRVGRGTHPHWLLIHGVFLSDETSGPRQVYALGQHGMSRKWVIACYEDLIASNATLNTPLDEKCTGLQCSNPRLANEVIVVHLENSPSHPTNK